MDAELQRAVVDMANMQADEVFRARVREAIEAELHNGSSFIHNVIVQVATDIAKSELRRFKSNLSDKFRETAADKINDIYI